MGNRKKMTYAEAKARGISRANWVATVSKTKLNYVAPSQPTDKTYPCVNRGETVRKQECKSCRGNVSVKVLSCRVHKECVVRNRKGVKTQGCDRCPARQEDGPVFEDFMQAHTGACYVFGSGKTDFNYNRIGAVVEPAFFINQSGQLADKRPSKENYMFALDKKQGIYFKDFPGTLVLADNTPMHDAMGANPSAFQTKTVWYRNGYKNASEDGYYREGRGYRGFLQTDKALLQEDRILYQGDSGVSATIMPLLHFVWYCGFDTVNMVGCDGYNNGYDPRIENRTGQKHDLNSGTRGNRFSKFREHQDEIAGRLGLTLNYL